jgi:hypothetical protein
MHIFMTWFVIRMRTHSSCIPSEKSEGSKGNRSKRFQQLVSIHFPVHCNEHLIKILLFSNNCNIFICVLYHNVVSVAKFHAFPIIIL